MSNSAAIASSPSGEHPGDALRPYLPATLLESAARQHSATWYEWLEGSLMHCDISGFTAMSEDLAGRGKEGAELMVGVLNHFFEVMLGVAGSYGGVQMKFGGDAMLLYFGGNDHANRAAACGLAMQSEMRPFGKVMVGEKAYRLRMRAGIHSGRFFSASAGDPASLLHYVLTGEDVSRAAAVEAAAGLGHVACTAATAGLLHDATLRPAEQGIFRVTAAPAQPVPVTSNPVAPQVAEHYVAPILRQGRTHGSGEHRRVSVAFINVLGLEDLLRHNDDKRVLDTVSTYVSVLVDLLDRYRGHLLGSDVADHGDKFIALFGAPIADERQETAALRLSMELLASVKKAGLPVRQKIGVNTGYVFAGEVGSRARREYTVIGDSVNLSARLMAAAGQGQVLTSTATADRAAGLDFQRLRPVLVKGKRDPVPVMRVRGVTESMEATPRKTQLFGREQEISLLLRTARAAKRAGRFACIWGEPGIGKSALTGELADRLAAGGWNVVRAGCHPHTFGTPFAPWLALLGQVGHATPELARDAAHLTAFLEAGAGPDSDPRAFRTAAIQGIIDVISRAASNAPLHVLIEDLHWADESSLAVIERLAGAVPPRTFVCATSRTTVDGLPAGTEVHLAELPPEAAREFVITSGLGADGAAAVLEKSRGNPLFLTEFVRAGHLSRDLPDTVNDLMMARIDALAPDERQVLRVASVIGQQFDEGFLLRLANPPLPADRVLGTVPTLVERGFTRVDSPEPASYAFTHALLSDVAYESAPFAFRRNLHLRAGELIEAEHAGELEPVSVILLHHFERAGNLPRTVKYAALAGERSARVFSNREAMDYYRRAISALAGLPGAHTDRSLLLERCADILEVTGRHGEAAADYNAALDAWNEGTRRTRGRYIPWQSGLPAREAALCRKIAASRERAADYDGALGWLERARASAPRRGLKLRAQVNATTCVTLFRKGEYAQAIAHGREAVKLAGRARDTRLTAYAHNMVANALIESGRLRAAVRHLRPAVRLYHEAGDFTGQASSNNNLGSCYQLLGMYDAALYHYDVALRADDRTGDEVDAAIVHNNMAETLLLLEREDEALERLDEVLRVSDREPNLADLAAWAHVTTARCYRAMGRLAEASRHLAKGTRRLRALNAQGLLAEALADVAEQSLADGRPSAASVQARRAIKHAAAINARLPEARSYRLLGESLLALGRTADGEAALRTGLDLSRRVDAGHEEAHAELALGRHHLHSGRKNAATSMLTRAQRAFSRAGAHRQAALAARALQEAAA